MNCHTTYPAASEHHRLLSSQEIVDVSTHLVLLQEEAVVTVDAVDDSKGCAGNMLRQLFLLLHGVQDITVDAQDECGASDAFQRRYSATAMATDVVGVHNLRQLHVGQRVEAIDELLTLMLQIRLHLKQSCLGILFSAEFLLVRRGRSIRDHRHLSCEGQPLRRRLIRRKSTAFPIVIGIYCLALGFRDTNLPRAMLCSTANDDR